MENLRWIILALGLLIVLLIYLFGRNKNKSAQLDLPEPLSADEMPDISTSEEQFDVQSMQGEDEFISSEINHFELDQELVARVAASVDDVLPDVMTTGSVLKSQKKEKLEIAENETETDHNEQGEAAEVADGYQDDLIVIHVKAVSAFFNGADLLRVINHQQLKFGDMNIYHAYDDSNAIIFSMSNMIQPGHFEPDQISDMRTPGVILFMQLSLVNEPDNAFERMIHCAQTMSRELDGKITMANQQGLTDSDIDAFREKAAYFKKSM